jgi:hypothetical protein
MELQRAALHRQRNILTGEDSVSAIMKGYTDGGALTLSRVLVVVTRSRYS